VAVPQPRTSRLEQLLLMAAIILLPLQDHLPSVYGFSAMYIIFGVLAGYALLTKPIMLARMAVHPVVVTASILIILCSLIEFGHSDASYVELRTYALSIGGAVAVATLCRDRRALQASAYGYLIMSIWLSAFLMLTFYSTLHGAMGSDLREVSKIRDEVFEDNPLNANLNKLAFQVAQGAVVALAFGLSATTPRQRALLLAIGLFCMVGVFLPMSRGGILIAFISGAVVLLAFRGQRMRALLVVAALGIGVAMWAPSIAFTRLKSSVSASYYEEGEDSRARIWLAAIDHLPEYVVTGVGAGNYWDWWGITHGFDHRGITVLGAHNSFFQVTIFWGFVGLFAFLAVLWRCYRCIPKRSGADALSLCLLGIAVSLVLRLFVSHNFADKDFTLGIGLLVGARSWIWPAGIVQPISRG
jgi:hypothetical protein